MTSSRIWKKKDPFELAITRFHLSKKTVNEQLLPLLRAKNSQLRLQGLLTLFKTSKNLDKKDLLLLLQDENPDIQRMALVYIGEKGLIEMEPALYQALRGNQIAPSLFETFLATIRHLRPEFIAGIKEKSGKSSKIPRELPESFITNILNDATISEEVKATALPYLLDLKANKALIMKLLKNAKNEKFQMALMKAAQSAPDNDFGDTFKDIAFGGNFTDNARSMALSGLIHDPRKYFPEVLLLLQENSETLQYTAIKYLCQSSLDEWIRLEIEEWIANNTDQISETALSVWASCNNKGARPKSDKEWYQVVNGKGNAKLGRLVFENKAGLCTTCHKVNGWGGAFGPELSNIGSSKSKTQLAMAILEPSKDISPEWQGWYLIDQEGNKHTGRQIDVHLENAELMNMNGEYDVFEKPRSYGVMENSLMPDGLENTMTALEFNDLIAYLSHLK